MLGGRVSLVEKKRKEFQFLSSPPTRFPPTASLRQFGPVGGIGESSTSCHRAITLPPSTLLVARPRSISFRFGFVRLPIAGSPPRPYAGKKKERRKNSTTLPANHVCASSLHWHRFRLEIDREEKFFLRPFPNPNTNTHAETRKINPVRQLYIVYERLRDGSLSPHQNIYARACMATKSFRSIERKKYNNQESAARRRGRRVPAVFAAGDRIVVPCYHDLLLSIVSLWDQKNFYDKAAPW